MTKKELIAQIQQYGVEGEYKGILSRCKKRELEDIWQKISSKNELSHLSISQIKMYLRCGLQYFFRYKQGLKIPPKASITLGKSFHTTCQYNYQNKITNQMDKSLSELNDYFEQDFLCRKQETAWEENEKPEEFLLAGLGLVKLARIEHFPEILPIAVEKEFEITFVNVPYKLKGYIDLIIDRNIIFDTKTSSKSYTEETVRNDMQLTCYSYAYRQIFKQPEEGVGFHIFVKTKTPKIQKLISVRDNHNHKRFLTLLGLVANGISKSVFLPTQPDNWWCSKEWCGYFQKCHEEI